MIDALIYNSFRITLYVGYDNNFLKYVARKDHKIARNTVNDIINLARPMFNQNGLGRRFNLKVLNTPKHFNENMNLREDAEQNCDECKDVPSNRNCFCTL